METKTLFLLTAIIGVVIFAIPEVFSIFVGQHFFYDDVNSKCGKCHPDIETQLTQTAIHATLTCTACHNVTLNQSSREGHAAVVPQCLDCHGVNGSYVMDKNNVNLYAPPAVSFSEPDMGESTPEAHVAFVKNASNANKACVSCHADAVLEISFVRPLYSQFYASQQTQSFTLTSTGTPNYTNIKIAGNPMPSVTHLLIPTSNISCTRCHQDIWTAINRPVAANGSVQWSQSGHVVWLWTSNTTREAKIHNPGYIGSAYSTSSEYCLWSCHKALVSSTLTGSNDVSPFNQPSHSAMRISCYYCHNGSATGYGAVRYVFSKPDNKWVQVVYPNASHGELWKNIENSRRWVHADACVACKRDSNYVNGGGNFTVYTEPATLVVKNP
jgi:hypothetical protein